MELFFSPIGNFVGARYAFHKQTPGKFRPFHLAEKILRAIQICLRAQVDPAPVNKLSQ